MGFITVFRHPASIVLYIYSVLYAQLHIHCTYAGNKFVGIYIFSAHIFHILSQAYIGVPRSAWTWAKERPTTACCLDTTSSTAKCLGLCDQAAHTVYCILCICTCIQYMQYNIQKILKGPLQNSIGY